MIMRAIVILMFIAALGGCTGARSAARPVYYYTLDYPAPAGAEGRAIPVALRINRFSVSPPFNTRRIIYADQGLHRNAYAHYQWIENPGEMLAYFLARDLRQSGYFQAVLSPGTSLPASHGLDGWVLEFIEHDDAQGCQAEVRLDITLFDGRETDPSRRILFQKLYHAKVSCSDQTPPAVARAMSDAVAAISKPIVSDIYNRLK